LISLGLTLPLSNPQKYLKKAHLQELPSQKKESPSTELTLQLKLKTFETSPPLNSGKVKL
jgi:hypothetical protein